MDEAVKSKYLTSAEARAILEEDGHVTNGVHYFGKHWGGCHSDENCCEIEFKSLDEAMHYMERITNFKKLRRL